MAQTHNNGPLASGDKLPGTPGGNNIGLAVLSQTFLIDFDATLVQTRSVLLPVNSQIVTILCDVLTAYNSATSATLTVGTAAAGTQYASGVNAKTAGRTTPTFTAAQLAAMDDTGTNEGVFATVTSVGQPTAGQVRVTVQYVQTVGI
jgi:phage-related tail protein